MIAGMWNFWAMYAGGFSAITKARAMVAFCKEFRALLPGSKGVFIVASDMVNGAKYAKFIGGTYKSTVDIYEVI